VKEGGKTRNIAIIDFWTQNALKPIHDNIYKVLLSLDQDGTHNQEAAFDRVVDLSNKFGCAHSFDLTSATDRFPVILQTLLVKSIFGCEMSELWSSLLIDRNYRFNGKNIRWGVGQPLGALSSWGVFALTHHVFIRYCANDETFDKYVILGDDVVIFDNVVASEYKKLMEHFGVGINSSKSFTSSGLVVYGEFCKRLFCGREELSPFPLKQALKACEDESESTQFVLSFFEALGVTDYIRICNFLTRLPTPASFKVNALLGFAALGLTDTDRSGILSKLDFSRGALRSIVANSIADKGMSDIGEKVKLFYTAGSSLDTDPKKSQIHTTPVPIQFGDRNLGRYLYLSYGGRVWTTSKTENVLFECYNSPFRNFVNVYKQKVFSLHDNMLFFDFPLTDDDLENVLKLDFSVGFPTKEPRPSALSVVIRSLKRMLLSGKPVKGLDFIGSRPMGGLIEGGVDLLSLLSK